MRFTLIPGDSMAYVDGDPRVLEPDVKFPENILAVQWYNTWGEIEFHPVFDQNGTMVKPENERFFDLSRFDEYITKHQVAVERDDKKHAEDVARLEERRARNAQKETAPSDVPTVST